MGSLCSLFDDKRPMLSVRVLKIDKLPMTYDDDNELDAYVQFTYGNLNKMTHRGQTDPSMIEAVGTTLKHVASSLTSLSDENSEDDVAELESNSNKMGRDSLSKGHGSTETKQTSVETTRAQARYFHDIFHFPVHSLNARHSLEISVWDKELGPQMTDDYIGKAIIYYAKYKEEQFDSSDEKGEYYLPTKWDSIKQYSIEIKDSRNTDDTVASVCGVVDIEVEFQTEERTDSPTTSMTENDSGTDSADSGDEQENDGLIKKKQSKEKNKKNKKKYKKLKHNHKKRQRSKSSTTLTESTCCG